jgi:hypothetical protein
MGDENFADMSSNFSLLDIWLENYIFLFEFDWIIYYESRYERIKVYVYIDENMHR